MKHFTLIALLLMMFTCVNAQDETPPVASCKDVSVTLDEFGFATLSPEDVDNGSTDDESGIASFELSLTEFSCENMWEENPVPVTLTVTDNEGNSSSCDAVVEVIDDLAPQQVYCFNLQIEITPEGFASLEAWELDEGSSDNCGIDIIEASQTQFFCEDLGENIVDVTFYDFSGNSASCQSVVTVVDNTSAEAVCLYGGINLFLESGEGSISLQDINDNYSSCNIASSTLSQTDFSCADIGVTEVVLTVVDIHGNETSCGTDIYIIDPDGFVQAVCQDVTVQLVDGSATISIEDIDGGSTASCGYSYDISQTTFGEENVGENIVTLTLTDASNNESSCEATVTVEGGGEEPVDCEVSEWSNWSECSEVCGGGVQIRTREVITEAANGGAECPVLIEEQACNEQACPVDCEVSEWSNWSECSEVCGGGVQIRTREVITEAANGGAECPVLIEEQACNEQACPVDCEVSEWSNFSECSAVCGGGVQIRTREVITAPANGGAACPALVEEQACNEQACPQPINCKVSKWSEWSECSETCGGGVQIRTRTILVPAQYGGAECPELVQTRSCNTKPCEECKVPKKPGKIEGKKNRVCQGTTSTYSIDPVRHATSYVWTVTNGGTIVSGQGTTEVKVFFPSGPIVYVELKVKAVNDCGSSPEKSYGGIWSTNLCRNIPDRKAEDAPEQKSSSAAQMNTDIDVHVYPNPTRGDVTVEIGRIEGDDNVNLRIMDLQGRLVQNGLYNLAGSSSVKIDTRTLPQGIYLLELTTNQHRKVVKLIKN